jgi:hypothetical protein
MSGARRRQQGARRVLAVALLLASADAARADGFTRDATVVVLSGLPGDLESERTYAEWLERLLAALAAPPSRPKRVVALVDTPETVTAPPGLTVEARGIGREAVRVLASQIGEGALVVFAWGHGGSIDRSPVLHVRGPRIGPDDLATLAAGAATSRWVLAFRGSGAFARTLAGPSSEVLASDAGSASSDPIAMEAVVATLAAAPEATFPELAERVGRWVAGWYEGRNLVRTEEPMLWRPQERPQRLASAAEAAAPAAGPPDEEAAPAAAAPGTTQTTVPPAWSGIEPVDPADYPDAPAVVLRRSIRFTIGEEPSLTRELDQWVQVLSPEGEAFADLELLHEAGEALQVLDLEIRHPDGTLERVDPGPTPVAARAAGEYPVPAAWHASLPQARPGAILRVHARITWRDYPLPHVTLEVPLADPLPALATTVSIAAPSREELRWLPRGGEAPPPETVRTPYGTTLTWRFPPLPPFPDEPLAPPQAAPRLLASTFPSWADFDAWYGRLVREADQVTPEIAGAASEITRGAKSDRERVERLFRFVTALRYVAVPLGVSSHRPHAAATVLANRYGDCKDKANLLNTLLRSLGISADLVLVPRFGEAVDELPGLAFNHAISRVHLAGEMLWLDTTDEVTRFPMLPPGDPGRRVLVVGAGSTGLTALPAPEPAAHRLVLRTTLEPPGMDAGQRARVTAAPDGFPDYALRLAARGARAGIQTVPVLTAAGWRVVAGGFAMASQSHPAPSELALPFTVESAGSWSGLHVELPDGRWLQRAPWWIPADWDIALHRRTLPLRLHQGYPLRLEQEARVLLPAGVRDLRLPRTAGGGKDGPLSWTVTWERAGNDALRAGLRVELDAGELDSAATARLQSELRRMLNALGEGALFTPPGAGSDAGADEGSAATRLPRWRHDSAVALGQADGSKDGR